MGLHTRDANANYSRKVDRQERIKRDVTEDVRNGDLTPEAGARIIEEHRNRG